MRIMDFEKAGERAPHKGIANLRPAWKPGESGNKGGRPKGSRNKLGEQFIADVYDVWQARGREVLESMCDNDPGGFARLVAGILPQKLEAELTLKPRIEGLPLYQQAPMRTIEHQPLEAIEKDE
jgi:hypothetical protein